MGLQHHWNIITKTGKLWSRYWKDDSNFFEEGNDLVIQITSPYYLKKNKRKIKFADVEKYKKDELYRQVKYMVYKKTNNPCIPNELVYHSWIRP